MEKGRFLLIYMDRNVYRFKYLTQAKRYAICNCRDPYNYYVIVDLEKDEVILKWIY